MLLLALQQPSLSLRDDTIVVQFFQADERLFNQARLRERLQQIQLDRSQFQAVDLSENLALSHLLGGLNVDPTHSAFDLWRRKGLMIRGQFDRAVGNRHDPFVRLRRRFEICLLDACLVLWRNIDVYRLGSRNTGHDFVRDRRLCRQGTP